VVGEEEDLFRPSSELSGRPSGSVGWDSPDLPRVDGDDQW
jgi:hypothetical protein